MNPSEIDRLLSPSRFDLALGSVFPRWAAARIKSRREFAYEAARSTRLRPSAARLQGPEDYEAFPDRIQLIREMRNLEQNFGLFQSIIDKLALYAFGRLRYQPHTGDAAVDEIYYRYLTGCFSACDLSGRHNFRSLVCLAFKSMLRDGDFALKWQRTEYGLKLVGIEGDRVGGIVMTSVSPNYFQGINVDPETGAPDFYRIYERTKGNAFVHPQEIPAQEILFLFDPRRYDQYRGITPFAPCINEAKDLKEVLEACLIGTKFENYHSAIGYTASGLPLDDPSTFIQDTGAALNGITQQDIPLKYGVVQWAPNNAKVDFIQSNRPSQNFQKYLETLIRLIGTALNLPYGFLYDLSGLTGPAARMDAKQAQRVIGWHQENMVERVLERAKNSFLIDAIGAGKIPYSSQWNFGQWKFPPGISIDAGRDSAAGINEWKVGLLTKESWFAEEGQDSREQESIVVAEADRTLTQAKALSLKHEVPIDLALTMLEARLPNGFIARASVMDSPDDLPPGVPPPEASKPEE